MIPGLIEVLGCWCEQAATKKTPLPKEADVLLEVARELTRRQPKGEATIELDCLAGKCRCSAGRTLYLLGLLQMAHKLLWGFARDGKGEWLVIRIPSNAPGNEPADACGPSVEPLPESHGPKGADALKLRLFGSAAIAEERARQIAVEEHDPLDDVRNYAGQELALAALCYLWHGVHASRIATHESPLWWPWNPSQWKPKDYRRDLERAGALIAAELDRIDIAERLYEPAAQRKEAGRGSQDSQG